jgi:hypothetical protein
MLIQFLFSEGHVHFLLSVTVVYKYNTDSSSEIRTLLSHTIFNINFLQDYWVFGLCPSSGIPKNTEEHNVSETGSVSFFR